ARPSQTKPSVIFAFFAPFALKQLLIVGLRAKPALSALAVAFPRRRAVDGRFYRNCRRPLACRTHCAAATAAAPRRTSHWVRAKERNALTARVSDPTWPLNALRRHSLTCCSIVQVRRSGSASDWTLAPRHVPLISS